MTTRSAKVVLVMSAGIFASISIATIASNTSRAAEECLTTPKTITPAGQHWYYRIDGSTKRQCWYLRSEGATSSAAAVSASPAKPAAVARSNDSTLMRSTAEAHAELPSPDSGVDGGRQIPPPTPNRSADTTTVEQDAQPNELTANEQSPVASRWPEPAGELTAASERPVAAPFTVASTQPEPDLTMSADRAAAPAGSDVMSTSAEPPVSRTPVPLQMLLLGASGALAFSGLTGGAIYLGRTRRRPRSDAAMSQSPGWSPPDDAYRLYAPARPRARPVDSARRADAHSGDRLTRGLSDNGHEIAQLLARFADQAEAEP